MDVIQFLLVILTALPILATILLGYQLFRNGRGSLGKPTISPGLFYSAKIMIALVFALLFIIGIKPDLFLFFPGLIQHEIPDIQRLMSMILLWTGNLFLLPAYYSMSIFTRVGLPASNHTLRTSGIYRFSRNPMYFSFYFFYTACFLLVPSFLLLIMMIGSLVIHHQIILNEEKFLTGLFRNRYLSYKEKVPRYL